MRIPTKSKFLRNTASIAIGTISAQFINFVSFIFLARLYSTSDFGLFAVLMSLATIGSAFLTFRYELAVVLENDRVHKDTLITYLFLISFIACLFIGIISPIVRVFCNEKLLDKIDSVGLLQILILMLIMSWINIQKNIALDREQYKIISIAPIFQSTIFFLLAIILIVVFDGKSMLYAAVASALATFIIYFYKLKLNLTSITPKKISDIKFVFKKYRDLALYGTPSVIIDNVIYHLPILWFAIIYDEATVGLYSMVVRVASAPLSVFSSSIGQVHFKTYAEGIEARNNMLFYLAKVALITFVIGFIPTIFFFVYGEQLFILTFGPEWQDAGKMLEIMAFALFFKFIASTLSPIFEASNRMVEFFMLKCISIVTLIIFFVVNSDQENVFSFLRSLAIIEIFISFGFIITITFCVYKPRYRA